MTISLDEKITQVREAITELNAKRSTLGDEVVESALAPLRVRLDELLRLRQTESLSSRAPVEQRKQVSVLCADLAGFTALSAQLDPEVLREIQQAYFQAVTLPVQKWGGVVEKYIGDAVLAVFGLPAAHENDPERAVRAALDMQSSLAELNDRQAGETGFPLQMRVGLCTGMVLATLNPGEGDFVVTGETVNLASRIQNLAPPGGVLIPHDTYRHLRGAFDVQVLEPVQIKGYVEPVTVYRVLRAKPRSFRQTVRGVEGIETPLVGRQTELKELQDAMMGVIEEREGQLVTIRGDAGVGKSRLLYEFQNWIELLPVQVRFFQGKARQEAQGLPFGLLRDLFAFRFQILDDDPLDAVWGKLKSGFGEVFTDDEDGQMQAHFLGQLLGYDFSRSSHLKGVLNDAEQLRNRGMMYLSEYFKGLCEKSPLVIFLEDLHWADDSSLDAVIRLGELAPHLGLLIVGAARGSLLERRPFWGEGLEYHHFVELPPLSKRESRQLVGEILRLVDEIPAELRVLVVEGGEGNPFYIEELIKMLVERGVIVKGEKRWGVETSRLEQLAVPATLAGVLQARLDGLPADERKVLQQASVVGRLFWDQVVAYIHAAQSGEAEELLVPQALSVLRGRELVYRREESVFVDSTEYLFKHDILREVTYESVLKRLRKTYHSLVADWLIAHCGDRLGEFRGLIADHLLLGGRKEQALEYLQATGEAALASFANSEAESYFRRSLELNPGDAQHADLLACLGEALKRLSKHEPAIQVFREGIEGYLKLGNQDKVAHLYASLSGLFWREDYLKAFQVCQEGLELLEGAPDSPGMSRLLAEAGRTGYFRAEPPERVVDLCQRAMVMAESLGETVIQAEALITLALTVQDKAHAIRSLEQAVSLADSLGPCSTAYRAHLDLGYYYDIYSGDLYTSLKEEVKAAEIARQIGDIDSIFFALFNAGYLQIRLGNLNSVIDFLAEFLGRCSVSQELVDEFLGTCSSYLWFPRGEWQLALEFARNRQVEMRKAGKLQEIADINLFLVPTILDLDQFLGRGELPEARSAMLENLNLGWKIPESRFLLAMVSARQGELQEAQDFLKSALEMTSIPENIPEELLRLDAEAEIALAMERWEQALLSLESRIEILDTGGYRWEMAHDILRLGVALSQKGEPGDLERALDAYQHSLEMFTEMDAPGYINVVAERLRAVGAQ